MPTRKKFARRVGGEQHAAAMVRHAGDDEPDSGPEVESAAASAAAPARCRAQARPRAAPRRRPRASNAIVGVIGLDGYACRSAAGAGLIGVDELAMMHHVADAREGADVGTGIAVEGDEVSVQTHRNPAGPRGLFEALGRAVVSAVRICANDRRPT
jgi:hypothetical protein